MNSKFVNILQAPVHPLIIVLPAVPAGTKVRVLVITLCKIKMRAQNCK